MVPGQLVKLGELPLTANGKVDRGRLPEAGERGEEGEVGYVAPGTAIEEQLCAIWAEVLSLPKVGVHDNFFDLGGHSLLMIRLRSELQRALGRDISMVDLFAYSTIRSLAKYLNRGADLLGPIAKLKNQTALQREYLIHLATRREDKNEHTIIGNYR
jgi:acyl carrier protein